MGELPREQTGDWARHWGPVPVCNTVPGQIGDGDGDGDGDEDRGVRALNTTAAQAPRPLGSLGAASGYLVATLSLRFRVQ